MQAAEIAGIRALLVHAVDDRAAEFYLRAGSCLRQHGHDASASLPNPRMDWVMTGVSP